MTHEWRNTRTGKKASLYMCRYFCNKVCVALSEPSGGRRSKGFEGLKREFGEMVFVSVGKNGNVCHN